jgi:hypothetical protein
MYAGSEMVMDLGGMNIDNSQSIGESFACPDERSNLGKCGRMKS